MSDQEEQKIEAPDAGDFDLMSWMDGNHTYPEYTVTVYLDKAAVAKSNALAAEIEKLTSERNTVEEALERSAGHSSLADTSSRAGRHGEIAKELKAKRAEREKVMAGAKGSALKIVLRKPPVDEDVDGSAFDSTRKAMAERYPEHASVLNNVMDQKAMQELFFANPHLAHEQNVLMWHYMVASVTTANGNVVERGPKLTEEVLSNLIKRLDPSDTNRVQSNMNLAMSGSELREDQIDAGFPS